MNKSLKALFSLSRLSFQRYQIFKKTYQSFPKFTFSTSPENNPNNNNEKPVLGLQNQEVKLQAKKALEETQNQPEEKFTLDDKTFTAKIGSSTLTYTRYFNRKS